MSDWADTGISGELGCSCYDLPAEADQLVELGFGSRGMTPFKCNLQDMIVQQGDSCANDMDRVSIYDWFPLGTCIVHPVSGYRYTASCDATATPGPICKA